MSSDTDTLVRGEYKNAASLGEKNHNKLLLCSILMACYSLKRVNLHKDLFTPMKDISFNLFY